MDPLENRNRSIYAFNENLDEAILEPAADSYNYITPNFLQKGFNNFFDNINYAVRIVNQVLQGNFEESLSDTLRFTINSSIGILGLFDPASKMGLPDPDQNPRLRSAIVAARSSNMTKDRIERAINKAAGGDNETVYEEIRYEGYGPHGVALIVDALTDNRNRTASEVRAAFSKYGGNLGETNSVAFMFDRIGQIVFDPDVADMDLSLIHI